MIPTSVENNIGLFEILYDWRRREKFYEDCKRLCRKEDLISKNIPSRHIEICNSYFVKINFARHEHDTDRTQKKSGIVAVDSCFAFITLLLGSQQRRRRRQREHQKSNLGLFSKTANLHLHHSSAAATERLYDVKMPNFTFYGGSKQATTNFSFAF